MNSSSRFAKETAVKASNRRTRSRRGIATTGSHVEAVKSSLGRASHGSNRLPPPFAAEHALLECRGIPQPVAAGAGLGIAKIEVGIEDGIAARLSVGTH